MDGLLWDEAYRETMVMYGVMIVGNYGIIVA